MVVFDVEGKEVLLGEDGKVSGIEVERDGQSFVVKAGAVVLCAGGFEANPELRKKFLAKGWEKAHTRGTPYNTGDMLLAAQRVGAKLVGDFSSGGCHSTAWDYDSPADGGDRENGAAAGVGYLSVPHRRRYPHRRWIDSSHLEEGLPIAAAYAVLAADPSCSSACQFV